MTENTIRLPVFATIKSAWKQVKGAKGTFWAVFFTIFLIQLLNAGASYLLDGGSDGTIHLSNGLEFIISILALLLYVPLIGMEIGLLYISIQRGKGLPIQYKMIKKGFNIGVFFKTIGVAILMWLLYVPTLIFFYLPEWLKSYINLPTAGEHLSDIFKLLSAFSFILGFLSIFIALNFIFRFSLAYGLVVSQNLNPWKAIKTSFKATKSNVWRLVGLWMIHIFILMVSAIPFGIGLIWTLPLVWISLGVAFNKLIGSQEV